MTLKELKDKVRVRRSNGYGRYLITITFRGNEYSVLSNNSLAWDRISDGDDFPNKVSGYYTLKQAYQAFYDECKEHHSLT